MKWKSTLALAAVLGLLVAGYFLMLYSEKEAAHRVEEAKRFFSDLTAADVSDITLVRPDAQTIAAARAGDGWVITKPYELPAANPAWDRVAAALSGLQNERTIDEDPEDLSVYGLSEPSLTLSFTTSGGDSHQFAFGVTDPTERYRFTRGDDESVALLDDKMYQELNRTLDELRNRFMVGNGSDEIVRMALTRYKEADQWDDSKPPELAGAEEQVTVAFERDDEGVWSMTLPIAAKADQRKVQAMWQIVQYAVGNNFVDQPESLDDYGLAPTGARLTVGFTSDRPDQSVYFGSLKGSGDDRTMYVKQADRPSVFEVNLAVKQVLPDTPVAFREYRLLTRNIGGLTKYVYHEGAISLTLGTNAEGGWEIQDPPGLLLDQKAFSIYLSFLVDASGDNFPAVEPQTFDEGATIDLYFVDQDEGAPPVRIALGGPGPDGEMWYAKQDTGDTMLITTLVRDALRASVFKFEEKRLAPVKRAQVQRVAMRFEESDYVFERRDERWVVTQPDGKVWQRQADMELLLDALLECEATALETSLPADGGVPDPILDVTISGGDGQESQRQLAHYTIGAITSVDDQARYAQAEGRDRIVHIHQRTIDKVREALRGVVNRE